MYFNNCSGSISGSSCYFIEVGDWSNFIQSICTMASKSSHPHIYAHSYLPIVCRPTSWYWLVILQEQEWQPSCPYWWRMLILTCTAMLIHHLVVYWGTYICMCIHTYTYCNTCALKYIITTSVFIYSADAVEFSRPFITTVVLGNDAISRLNICNYTYIKN